MKAEAICSFSLERRRLENGESMPTGIYAIDQDRVAAFINGIIGDLEITNNSIEMVIDYIINMFGNMYIFSAPNDEKEATLVVKEVKDFDFQRYAESQGYENNPGDKRAILIIENTAFVFYGIKDEMKVLLCYYQDVD